MGKTLTQKTDDFFAKAFFVGYFTVALTVLPYCIGRMFYDNITAKKTVQSSGFIPSTFHGFDDNNDGEIDRFVEYSAIAGARMAAPTRSTYTPRDKEFLEIAKLFKEN